MPKIFYEGKESRNPFSFKFYEPNRKIMGKAMREHLKFAMPVWNTLNYQGVDMFGERTMDTSFGNKNERFNDQKLYAMFEFMDKLSIDYFCFHDYDIINSTDDYAENCSRLDEATDVVQSLMNKYDKKLLWSTVDLFHNHMYANGAATSPQCEVFIRAAAQIKKAIDICKRLDGKNFVLWGGREGYDTLLNTDMEKELNNYANFLKMCVEYSDKIGYTGGFLIEPKAKEPLKHQYDFDVNAIMAFLYKHDLTSRFKINLEVNHAILAKHDFVHELRLAIVNDMFGSIDANDGDSMLGWDIDKLPSDVYNATLIMYEIIKAGGFKSGGLNFDAKLRRCSNTFEDLFYGYITAMDTYALGLINAEKIIADGRIDEMLEDRYKSYDSEIGQRILSQTITLDELVNEVEKLDKIPVSSGRQEYLEGIINSIIYK